MNTDTLDYLIIGQGLAGSLLAWELAGRGHRIRVVDANWHGSSSLVAAGLVNPVTGKRLVLQEGAEGLLTQAQETYGGLESALGEPFFHPTPLLRLFVDADQLEYFHRRQEDPAQTAYWDGEASTPELAPFDAPWGGAWQRRTGYLDTTRLLTCIRQWLADRGELIERRFDYAAVNIGDRTVRWGDFEADTLVFCEGFGALRNPWLGSLPFQPAKGEILTLEWEAPPSLPEAIIHKGIWLAPRPDGCWRLGATHVWDPLDTEPTATGAEGLMRQLQALVPGAKARIVEHRAGVRPATRDRMPFLGRLPDHPRLAVFNGFGAKGSLLIPACAGLMADHLCDETALPAAMDIRRYG